MINKDKSAERLLLGAEDGDAALVEVMRVLLGGDVKINGENEIGAREVQIDGQRDLQREEDTVSEEEERQEP